MRKVSNFYLFVCFSSQIANYSFCFLFQLRALNLPWNFFASIPSCPLSPPVSPELDAQTHVLKQKTHHSSAKGTGGDQM